MRSVQFVDLQIGGLYKIQFIDSSTQTKEVTRFFKSFHYHLAHFQYTYNSLYKVVHIHKVQNETFVRETFITHAIQLQHQQDPCIVLTLLLLQEPHHDDDWFDVYFYHSDLHDRPLPMPLDDTIVNDHGGSWDDAIEDMLNQYDGEKSVFIGCAISLAS